MPSVEIIQMINEYGGRSFSNMWNQKVFAFAGCSSGRGGRLPAIHLTQIVGKILNFLEFDSFIAPKIFESQFTSQVLDEEGQSKGNFDYDHGLKQFVLSAVKFGKRWQEA
jgi:chromate reductase